MDKEFVLSTLSENYFIIYKCKNWLGLSQLLDLFQKIPNFRGHLWKYG